MYTSGTTGKPKGAIRNHRGGAMLSLVTEIELGLSRHDSALLVMPMCHANSLYFYGAFSFCGGACAVYNRKSFDPEHLVRTLAEGGASFTSLVPTHYSMMLDLSAATRAKLQRRRRHQADDLVGAGAARDQARDHGVFQEQRPVRALRLDRGRLGDDAASRRAVRQARLGRARMRRLAADPPPRRGRQRGAGRRAGRAVLLQRLHLRRLLEAAGKDAGSLPRRLLQRRRHGAARRRRLRLSRRPQEQHDHLRRRERLSVRGRGAAGDAREGARRGGDRPPDAKWGERVHAVIVARDGEPPSEAEIIEWCRTRIAGYKRPRSVVFIRDADMPRTATGKIQHRLLRMQQEAASQRDNS